MNKPYPWQTKQWQTLQTLRHQKRLPHGLMLVGQRGLGLNDFAQLLAQSSLCQRPDKGGRPCEKCQPCTLFAAETHPDFRFITPEEDKQQISIDQVRELQSFMQLSQAGERSKITIVTPAESMNLFAANSLLKTLEEPPGDSLLILVTHQPGRLPATIRSRCRIMSFPKPEKKQAAEWLQQKGYQQTDELLLLAQGAPCLAAQLSDEVGLQVYQQFVASLLALIQRKQRLSQLSELWLQIPPELLFSWHTSLLRDLIRAASGVEMARFENQNEVQHLQKIAVRVNLGKLFGLYDQLIELSRSANAPLNPELLRERMALLWMQAFAS